jgi:hypothetical protein
MDHHHRYELQGCGCGAVDDIHTTSKAYYFVYLIRSRPTHASSSPIFKMLITILFWDWSRDLAPMEAHIRAGKGFDETRSGQESAVRSAKNRRGPWWNVGASHVNAAFPKSYFVARADRSRVQHFQNHSFAVLLGANLDGLFQLVSGRRSIPQATTMDPVSSRHKSRSYRRGCFEKRSSFHRATIAGGDRQLTLMLFSASYHPPHLSKKYWSSPTPLQLL